MKERIVDVILIGILIFSLSYLLPDSCNPEGSLAAQINWAGKGICK